MEIEKLLCKEHYKLITLCKYKITHKLHKSTSRNRPEVIGLQSTYLILHLLDRVERHGDQGDQHQDGGGDAHELGRDGGEGLLHQVPHLPASVAQDHAVEQGLVLLHLHLEPSSGITLLHFPLKTPKCQRLDI